MLPSGGVVVTQLASRCWPDREANERVLGRPFLLRRRRLCLRAGQCALTARRPPSAALDSTVLDTSPAADFSSSGGRGPPRLVKCWKSYKTAWVLPEDCVGPTCGIRNGQRSGGRQPQTSGMMAGSESRLQIVPEDIL